MADSLSDLESQFYATQLGLGENPPLPDITRLKYNFLLAVKNGDLELGGLSAAEVETVVASYLLAHPVANSETNYPVMYASSPTAFPLSRSAFIAAVRPGWGGPIEYDSTRYLDHPGPTGYLQWDYWWRRRSV